METIRKALEPYTKDSNTRTIIIFSVVGLIAIVLTYLYVFFIGRHHSGTLLAYLLPLIFLVLGGIFILVARLIDDPYASLGYIALALFLLFAAVISFITTLILFIFFF